MIKSDWFKLIISILICQSAGILGSFATYTAIPTWYSTLEKPALNPPSWVFAPVWTTLFVLMGIAAFLVWKKGFARRDVRIALGVFIVQLILNTLWSIIFFGAKNIGLAFIELTVLWLAITCTMYLFARISKPALWLLVPYILWVSFAGYLNGAIWYVN